tara:strand:+ start:802 stop:1299 length:498 start_codon:yes stop_codon:yes gene_type:complete
MNPNQVNLFISQVFYIALVIMNYQEKVEIAKAANVIVASNDPRFNYQFIKKQEHIDKFDETPDIVFMDRYDYSIKRDEGDDMNLPSLCPFSLASCQNNLEDMEAFYAAKFPRLPSEYHGILARYSSGELLTKKEVKNGIKKAKKKNIELPVGLSVAQGDHTLHFD